MAAVTNAHGWYAEITDTRSGETREHPIIAWGDDHMSGTLHAWILFPDDRGSWVRIVRDDQVDTDRYTVLNYVERTG